MYMPYAIPSSGCISSRATALGSYMWTCTEKCTNKAPCAHCELPVLFMRKASSLCTHIPAHVLCARMVDSGR